MPCFLFLPTGMHELLAPLVYVLHVDLQYLSQVRKLHEDHFTDGFDESLPPSNTNRTPRTAEGPNTLGASSSKLSTFPDLDLEVQQLLLLSDPYGAEGELGVVLSDRFMEHDAYCMFDRLMDGGSRGAVSMAELFSHSNLIGLGKGSPPVIEASSALYHLLNLTDPSLHSHLVELGVEPQYFALRWLRILFCREFNLEELLTIWDEVFVYANDTCTDLKAANHGFHIFCSDRGAFVASFGVSMILHLRQALLATENVTVCLQKLLNFPKNVDIKRLIEKAKSLHSIALEANESVYSSQSLSGLVSSRTPPQQTVPDSYWEERWQVLHKTESLPPQNNKNLVHVRTVKKRSFRERFGLVRTESDPSAGENNKAGHTIRCQLFCGSPSRKIENSEGLNQSLSFNEESVLFPDRTEYFSREVSASDSVTNENLNGTAMRSVQGEESSTSSANNDRENYENDTDKSSVTSNSFVGENAEQEVAFSNGNTAEEDVKNKEESTEPAPKDTKSVSGKFGWIFKFGRGSNGEGTDNNVEKSGGGNRIPDKDASVSVSNSNSVGHVARAENSGDKKVMGTIKNLGQSMLENIQVTSTFSFCATFVSLYVDLNCSVPC
jgi:TBC1 domain family member 5